ncbi:hypothetical protein [Tumebacillus flagellatus]|uniref:Uncharacterized protein n=1 Tax=Tumebacillus flagellatus TaxID=1157490 RepID=A0A074LXB0_9BACL|nr:hypothetical protein [Tumebacillus flagellatus]KEO84713.1 hypothetical protein EL26_04130 [Tumebacillus flagellatus]
MPYDLIAFGVMVLLITLLVAMITRSFRKRKPLSLNKSISWLALLLLIVAIPYCGHTQTNREIQMKHLLNTINQQSILSPESDKSAIHEISVMTKPIRYSLLREELRSNTSIGDKFYDEYLTINGQQYIVTIACYTFPLRWSVFETYSLNEVKK